MEDITFPPNGTVENWIKAISDKAKTPVKKAWSMILTQSIRKGPEAAMVALNGEISKMMCAETLTLPIYADQRQSPCGIFFAEAVPHLSNPTWLCREALLLGKRRQAAVAICDL